MKENVFHVVKKPNFIECLEDITNIVVINVLQMIEIQEKNVKTQILKDMVMKILGMIKTNTN